MYLLYGSLLILLLIALSLLAAPIIKNRGSLNHLILFSVFLSIFSFTLYQFSGAKTALYTWFAQGQAHYDLLTKFEELGGVKGAIASVQVKLQNNSNDAKGWLILGKLYLADQNTADAKRAFSKAHELNPNDLQITQFYKMLTTE